MVICVAEYSTITKYSNTCKKFQVLPVEELAITKFSSDVEGI